MSTSSLFGGPNSLAFKTFNVVFLGVPGYLDRKFNMTPEAQTQRLGELAAQTAKEGVARPIVWGRARPIGGNLIYVQSPVIKKEKQKAPSSGGKGGSKKAPDTYVERVYRSYAIRICEGPATGVIRIWRNNKLVYDARGNEWGAKNNGVFLKKARLYLGGWAQMPDPTLQSIWGVDNVPAHRGTCYMVIINEDLTDMGGSVPQYLFEVERAEGFYVTSRPYPIESSERLSVAADSAHGELSSGYDSVSAEIEVVSPSADIIAGTLRATLLSLSSQIEVVSPSANIIAGSKRQVLFDFKAQIEQFSVGGTVHAGSLKSVLINVHTSVEKIAVSASIQGGDLS